MLKYYNVYVQGQKYKTISSEGGYSLQVVSSMIDKDVAEGKLPFYDPQRAKSIQIIPVGTDVFEKA
jgi:hypothetical protein